MNKKKSFFLSLGLCGLLTTSIAIATTDSHDIDDQRSVQKSKKVKTSSRHIDYTSILIQPLKEELRNAKRSFGKIIDQAF